MIDRTNYKLLSGYVKWMQQIWRNISSGVSGYALNVLQKSILTRHWFWQESGATVYFQKLRITPFSSQSVNSTSVNKFMRLVWDVLQVPSTDQNYQRLKETQFWKVAIGTNYRERVHTVIKVIHASLISTEILFHSDGYFCVLSSHVVNSFPAQQLSNYGNHIMFVLPDTGFTAQIKLQFHFFCLLPWTWSRLLWVLLSVSVQPGLGQVGGGGFWWVERLGESANVSAGKQFWHWKNKGYKVCNCFTKHSFLMMCK